MTVTAAINILLTTRDISCVCSCCAVVCVHAHPSMCVYLCNGERDYKESDRKSL